MKKTKNCSTVTRRTFRTPSMVTPTTGKMFNHPSLTEPHKSVPLREIMKRYEQGLPLPHAQNREASYAFEDDDRTSGPDRDFDILPTDDPSFGLIEAFELEHELRNRYPKRVRKETPTTTDVPDPQ